MHKAIVLIAIVVFFLNRSSFSADAAIEPRATPPESIRIAKDFKVELLYSVPKEREGSWVCMCTDPKGRLIVSDQYGSLYRISVPPLGGPATQTRVEKIHAEIGEAQGLLWAFDSLYVIVNKTAKFASGVYRVRDLNNDDQLESVESLRLLDGTGEHGPHAIVLGPDGESLYVVTGNGTKVHDVGKSRVPRHWSEDHLLPRMPDGRGFMKDVLGPGGCIYRMDRDAKNWEIVATGFRNEYDAAFNHNGDLFTFDSDMEWDMNTPWYRPTRVCMVASGADFGWRNGTGKWQPQFADTLPPIINTGPGSPTGVSFGYGARFPAKYQNALFICDWSYGKLYAIHLAPDGAGYKAEKEEFAAASPLQLTDLIVHPDGAMYFIIGGRRTQSGLYRITYTGNESTTPAKAGMGGEQEREIRRSLEAYHGKVDSSAVSAAWRHLGSKDRYIRAAARVALEHQPVSEWQARALSERDAQASITALVATVRVTSRDSFHRKPADPAVDPALQSDVLTALNRIDWTTLTDSMRTELLRAYQLAFTRLGQPDAANAAKVIANLDRYFPAQARDINAMLCEILIYLQSPGMAAKTIALLSVAPSQEEQLEYAKLLRMLKTGWTLDERKAYLNWFQRAASYRGGASFDKFVENIKTEAVANMPEDVRNELKPVIEAKVERKSPLEALASVLQGRGTVKEWTVEELAPLAEKEMKGRNFNRGRQMFGAVGCFACHRFDNDGGAIGPDLTGVAGRFSARDLLESVITPNKEINDQYADSTIIKTDGTLLTGRIVNLAGDGYRLNGYSVSPNMLDPNEIVIVNAKDVKTMKISKVSPMPDGLLNKLNQDEILDLLAYLLSRGERNHPMFGKP